MRGYPQSLRGSAGSTKRLVERLSHEYREIRGRQRRSGDHVCMVNVRAVEQDQLWLMPPALSDWLPSDHLAWFVLDVIAGLDLSSSCRSLRADGRGGAS